MNPENNRNDYRSRALKDYVTEDSRPREKALKVGCQNLSTAELLAILVGSGSRGENVMDLCNRILRDHDNKLYLIARRSVRDLTRSYRGIGAVKAIEILAALELARRYQLEKFEEQPQILSSLDAYNYMRQFLNHLPHEEMWVMMLNRSKHVLSCQRISQGGTAMTAVDVKVLLRPAIEMLADGIIMAHNHPSDTPHPSGQDDQLTDKVAQACRAMDIHLLDHLVVCRGGRYYSYADDGTL